MSEEPNRFTEPTGFTYEGLLSISMRCKETGKIVEREIPVSYYGGRHEPDTNRIVMKTLRKAVIV